MLPQGSVELTVCGRPSEDLDLLRKCNQPIWIYPSATSEELLEAYRSADVFVFPSMAEGFGHVLLEAMASGLPIISTTRTAAPDLIHEGKEGFIAEPGNSSQIAQFIEYFLDHREQIAIMGAAARQRAEYFTWARFRTDLAEAVTGILEPNLNARAHQYV